MPKPSLLGFKKRCKNLQKLHLAAQGLSKRFQDALMKPQERVQDASGELLDRSGIDFGPLGIDFGTDFGPIFDLKTSPDAPS